MRNINNRIRKNCRRFLSVLLICCAFFMTACGRETKGPPENGFTLPASMTSQPTSATQPTSTTQTTEQTQPTEPTVSAEESSLNSLRQAMTETPCKLAVAYLGRTEVVDAVDILRFIQSRQPQLCEELPFLLTIPETNIVGCGYGELYCIVPLDPEASVTINGIVFDEDWNGSYSDLYYQSETGEPFLLWCSNDDWEPDTQVCITNSDGRQTVWYPCLDDRCCVNPGYYDNGEEVAMDFSAYEEQLCSDMNDNLGAGWEYPTVEDLEGTTWTWDNYRKDNIYVRYFVTFLDGTMSLTWTENDEQHEYLHAPWELTFDGEFATLSIDFGEFAGVQRFNVLWDSMFGELYTAVDVSDGSIEPGFERLYRYLTQISTPDPMELVGTWEQTQVEVEGWYENVEPGICTIVISGESEDTLTISYTHLERPDFNYANKPLDIVPGELYYNCGNMQWMANVDYVGPWDTTYALTLLEDGSLLLQNYWIMDGAPMVSYERFCRVD